MTNKDAAEYFYRQMEIGLIKNDEQQEAYEKAINALLKVNEEVENRRG